MLRFTFLISFILLSNFLWAQESDIYSIIKLQLDEPDDVAILLDLGIAADHVHFDHPEFVELFVNQREKTILRENGFTYNELIPNTKLHADKLAQDLKSKPIKSRVCGLDSFQLGSVAGYLDYKEVMTILQKINNDFPQITKLITIGQSHEGRDIVALKISDNANQDESVTEPSAYYDALTHAREPLSMMSTLYYISWLLENYDNRNEVAQFYVDNRELYFVLIVNPDGYVYNTSMAPNGGGGWRKNRRTINNECIGVDLNRNYNAQWEGPGSHSLEPCSDLYRGEIPNSEVETQSIQKFIDEIKPKSAFSSHSYSQVMIDPNKKVGNPDYDFSRYAGYSSEFTPIEYRGYGSADDLIGYLASGTTLDYLFEQGAYAWTPEIGTRFWEPEEDICRYVKEMLEPMKFVSKIAGEAPSYHNHRIASDQKLISGNTVELSVDIVNKGIANPQENITVELGTLGTAVSIENPSIEYLIPDEGNKFYKSSEKFRFEILDIEVGKPLMFEIRIFQNDILVEHKAIEVYPGEFNILFADDFESGLQKWKQSSNGEAWSITNIDSKSGTHSLVESKLNYKPEAVSIIQLTEPVSLINNPQPWLFFKIKHALDPQSARLRILVSEDDANWRAISTDGMRLLRNENSYTGHNYWSQESVNLSDYVEGFTELYIRFEFISQENYRTTDGVYIDDVRVLDYSADNSTSPTTDQITAEKIKLYPNPTSGEVYLEPMDIPIQEINIKVYNSLGQELKAYNNVSSSEGKLLNLNELTSGHLIIQLQFGDRRINKKVFKY